MFQRMLASALIAGVAAGLIAVLLHFAFVQKLILLGEQYETGAIVHFAGPAADPAEAAADEEAHGEDHAETTAEGEAADESALSRNLKTVVATVAVYVAYGFLLAAGFGVAAAFGHQVDARTGLLWGLGGYVTFQLAPALGLAPELPGTVAAELSVRQIWWWMTVAATGSGLALLAFGRHWVAFALAGGLLALPHGIGAPVPEGFSGVAPSELGAIFAARVLGVALVVWVALGWVAGAVWHREARRG